MNIPTPNPETRIALFQRKEIRRTIHNNEWWFVITDVVAALTDSVDASDYLKKLRRRGPSLADAFKGGGQLVPPLGIACETPGGRQLLQCWNTEGIFRLIQAIPSPKAEPFKRWLARVGYERIQEIEDLELATKRTRALYKAKGYSDDWPASRTTSCSSRGPGSSTQALAGSPRASTSALIRLRSAGASFRSPALALSATCWMVRPPART